MALSWFCPTNSPFYVCWYELLSPLVDMNRQKVGLLALALVLAVVVNHSHERTTSAILKQPAPFTARGFLPAPSEARMVSLGFDNLLADFYWLSFVQYVGENRQDGYTDAEKYIDLITGLDPRFVPAYYFASFIIGSEQKHPDIADRIINRGIAANPENWCLPFIAGINQYLYAHNDRLAAKYYRMAAKFPDAPLWLGRQAEILQSNVPSLIKEVNVWDRIYYSSEEMPIKEKARSKLVSLWLQIFKTAPSPKIKQRASEQLKRFDSSKASQGS